MYRDFSESSKQKLLELVSEVEDENWCGFTDWFGDRWLDFQDLIGQLDVKQYLNSIDEYHKKVIDKNNTTKKQIDVIFFDVKNVDEYYNGVLSFDKEILSEIEKYLNELSFVISPSNGMFNASIITFKFQSLFYELKKYLDKLGNPSYLHEDGEHYGGRQHGCLIRWKKGDIKEIRAIVKEYFPDYTNSQIKNLLDEMNSEGCNYMALVNTIFGQYIGREEEFERDFGYPMYDKDGYPNWDLVMLDFYCSEGEIDGKEYGLTKKTSEKRWENFLRKKGIKVDVVNLDVTVDNFKELSQDGEIIVAISPLRLRNADGKLVDDRNGGHAIVITDVVTINGKKMYKVSSWGEAYYIDPNDYDKTMRIEYQQVRY